MAKTCPHCGKDSNEEFPRFCSGCGARMDGTITAGFPFSAGPPRPQKSTMIAGFCSSILPGLGQVYNGETRKGFALFILALVGLVVFIIPGLIVWLYAMYDAYAVATKMNSGEMDFIEINTLHMVGFIVFAAIVIVAVLLIIIAMVMASLMSELGPLGSPDMASYNRMFKTIGLF
jgi:TM2 domain-containing membrane protein YozV